MTIKEKIKETAVSFEGKKFKPGVENVLTAILGIMFVLSMCVNDFCLNLSAVLLIIAWASIMFSIAKLLQKFGRNFLKE